MTDITSKNNYYYSAFQYNSGTTPVQAQVDEALVYPLLETSSDYEVALSKASIDLSTIPLTRSNIPLKKYEVGLRSGSTVSTAYVRQIGGTSGNYVYNISNTGVVSKYSYTSTGTTTQVSTASLEGFETVAAFFVDDFENYYVLGSILANATVFNTFKVFTSSGLLLTTITYPSITCATIDRRQNVYLGVNTGASSEVVIYSNANGINTVVLTQTGTLTEDKNGNPLGPIASVCADVQIVVGYGVNSVSIYNADTLVCQTTYVDSSITQLSRGSAIISSSDRFVLVDNGVFPTQFFGMKAGGDTTVYNEITNNAFVTGQYLINTNMVLTQNGYGFGVGTNEQLYYFTYDNATGAVGSPTLLNNAQLSNISTSFQPNTLTSIQSGALYQLNADNQTSSNWFLACNNFSANNYPIVSYAYQQHSGQIYAVGSDGNLYASSIAIGPKNFIRYVNYNFIIQPVGVNSGTTSKSYVNPAYQVFETQGNTLLILSSYANTNVSDGAYNTLTPDNANVNYAVNSYQINNFSNGIYNQWNTGIPQNFSTGADMCNVQGASGTSYRCVVSHLSGSNPPTIEVAFSEEFSSSTFYSFTYNVVTPPNMSIFCASNTLAGVNGKRVLVIGFTGPTGTTTNGPIQFFDVTNIDSSVVTKLNFDMPIPSGNGITGIWVHPDINNGNKIGVWISTDTTLAQNTINSDLSGVGTYDTLLTGQSYSFAPLYCENYNINEIYIPLDSLNSQVYNIVTKAVTSTIQFATSGTTGGLCCMPTIDWAFTFEQVTTNLVNITSVDIDKTNDFKIYVATQEGIVYYASTNESTLTFTAVPQITQLYQTVSTFPAPSSTLVSKAYNYSISSQTPEGTFNATSATPIVCVARNDVTGEFALSTGSNFVSLPPATFTPPNFTNTTIPNLGLIWLKNGQDISAGNADVYTMATLIEAINLAYLEAFEKLPSGTFQEPPRLTFDYATSLLTLNYSSDYPAGLIGSKFILMNPALLQLCLFPSHTDSLNPLLVDITPLPAGSTSLTQTGKSLYLFNQLDKIVFISNTIFVFGSFFGNNNTNNIITDIDVPTDSAGYNDNVGQRLYYQPSFLRPYMLSSNNALQRIQLSINYVYMDGSEYPLLIAPNTNFSAKLIFPRRY